MRNIFLSVVIVAALVVAGIGGTLADWTEDDHGDFCWYAGFLNLKVDRAQAGEPVYIMQLADFDIDGNTILDDWYYADDLGTIICDHNMEPGNGGEETLSFHIEGDSTIAGADLTVTGTLTQAENGMQEPEITAGDNTPLEGELADFLYIRIWVEEDGNNVYNEGPTECILYEGTLAGLVACAGSGVPSFYLEKCNVYFLGVQWELAHYTDAGVIAPANANVNQCMTDKIDGTVIFTVDAVHVP